MLRADEKKNKKRYQRIDYDEPSDQRENADVEDSTSEQGDDENYQHNRPFRRRRYNRPFRRFNNRRRFVRKPFIIETVFTEDATTLQLPVYKTTGSAGADLKALEDGVIPAHGMLTKVRTGVKVKIPNAGTVGWITPRSGMASENGITIINAPGEIDSDYRGEILISFANLSDKDFAFKAGDRIAQLTFVPVRRGIFSPVSEFSPDKFNNERGENGFGSTGMSDPQQPPVVTEEPDD